MYRDQVRTHVRAAISHTVRVHHAGDAMQFRRASQSHAASQSSATTPLTPSRAPVNKALAALRDPSPCRIPMHSPLALGAGAGGGVRTYTDDDFAGF
jgi:hypothetical protein